MFFVLFIAFCSCSTFKFYTTNDLHGNLSSPAGTIIGTILDENEVGKGNAIYLDAGDVFFGGAMEGEVTSGEYVRDIYQILGPAVSCIGNHEFDHTNDPKAVNVVKSVGFISSNVVALQDGMTEEQSCGNDVRVPHEFLGGDYKVVTVGGKKILFLALHTTQTSVIHPMRLEESKIAFCDQKDSLTYVYRKVLSLNVEFDYWTLLVHTSQNSNGKTAFGYLRDFIKNNINLFDKPLLGIITGHDHILLSDYDSNLNCYVTQEKNYAYSVGEHTFNVDDSTGQISVIYRRISVQDYKGDHTSCERCKKINQVYQDETYNAIFAEYLNVISSTQTTYTCNRSDLSVLQTEAGSLFTYIFYTVAKNVDKDVTVCMYNRGAIRSPLNEGDISTKNVFDVVPFANFLLIVKMSGKRLRTQIAANLKQHDTTGLVQLFGLRIYFDKNFDLIQIEDNDGIEIVDNKEYKILTNDFLYYGGDGLFDFSGLEILRTFNDLPFEIAAEFITEKGALSQRFHDMVTVSPYVGDIISGSEVGNRFIFVSVIILIAVVSML